MTTFYADYDSDSVSWCVFQEGSTLALSSWSLQSDAEKAAEQLNDATEEQDSNGSNGAPRA